MEGRWCLFTGGNFAAAYIQKTNPMNTISTSSSTASFLDAGQDMYLHEERFQSILITVVTGCDEDELYPDDVDVAGVYIALVPQHLEQSIAAATALEKFHQNVPIKRLFDFSIDTFGQNGRPYTPADDHDWYALAKLHASSRIFQRTAQGWQDATLDLPWPHFDGKFEDSL